MHKQIIDLDSWDRGQLFSFYIHEMPIVMSLTVDVDAAPLVSFAKRHGLRFYPAMIWAVSKVVNAHDEFKYGWDPQGRLIRWDCVFPSYADFHKEDQRFTKLVTPLHRRPFCLPCPLSCGQGALCTGPGHPARPAPQLLRCVLPALGAVPPL